MRSSLSNDSTRRLGLSNISTNTSRSSFGGGARSSSPSATVSSALNTLKKVELGWKLKRSISLRDEKCFKHRLVNFSPQNLIDFQNQVIGLWAEVGNLFLLAYGGDSAVLGWSWCLVWSSANPCKYCHRARICSMVLSETALFSAKTTIWRRGALKCDSINFTLSCGKWYSLLLHLTPLRILPSAVPRSNVRGRKFRSVGGESSILLWRYSLSHCLGFHLKPRGRGNELLYIAGRQCFWLYSKNVSLDGGSKEYVSRADRLAGRGTD